MPNDMSCCGYKYGFICNPTINYGNFSTLVSIYGEDRILSFIVNHMERQEKQEGKEFSECVDSGSIIDFNCLSGLTLEEIKSYDEHGLLSSGPYMFFVMYDSVNYCNQDYFSDIPENEKVIHYVRYVGAIDISDQNLDKSINDLVASHLMSMRGQLKQSNQNRANVFMEKYTSSWSKPPKMKS